ncbi:MAG TPA: hypothetical protein VFI65_01765 [Streptosporangiaceae bacterium]|nr:hypothetical protein [Streptosporangiaceae bacterium]
MTGETPKPDPTPDPADPAGLLSELGQLRRNARSARHAYWFPLVLFGLLTVAAIPFYVTPGFSGGSGPDLPILGGYGGFIVQSYLGYYWLAALLLGLALTMWWYRRHARRIGLRTPARAYLITVGAVTVLALVLPFLARLGPFRFINLAVPADLIIRGTFPFLIIAIGLCVLAWAERSLALGVIGLVYTGTALLASLYDIENVLFRLGWNPVGSQWRFTSLPNVLLPATVLLATGVGAFVVQRKQRSVA